MKHLFIGAVSIVASVAFIFGGIGNGNQIVRAQSTNLIPVMGPTMKFATCAALNKEFPYGISQSKAASAGAKRRGLVPPDVDPKSYRLNQRLDRDNAGYVCTKSLISERNANARRIAQAIASGYPPALRRAKISTTPGSSAENYLEYLAQTGDSQNWYRYGSQGIVAPPAAPSPTRVLPRTSGSTIRYQIGDSPAGTFEFRFDGFGRVATWTNPIGPLEKRIWRLATETEVVGLVLRGNYLFQSFAGSGTFTGVATNTTSQEIGIDTDAVYEAPDGRRIPAQIPFGLCVQPGMSVPVYAGTQLPTPVSLDSSWTLKVHAAFGNCIAIGRPDSLNIIMR